MIRVRAVRGATTVVHDTKEDVTAATAELLREMLARNHIAPEDLVSIIFTATADIHSEFPAAAARGIGLSDVPLLCAQELEINGAMPRCIRVLMHAYTELDLATLRHVYLGAARQLRTDLPE